TAARRQTHDRSGDAAGGEEYCFAGDWGGSSGDDSDQCAQGFGCSGWRGFWRGREEAEQRRKWDLVDHARAADAGSIQLYSDGRWGEDAGSEKSDYQA